MMEREPVPSAVALASFSVPEASFMPPENVLAPDNVRVAEPEERICPAPTIGKSKVPSVGLFRTTDAPPAMESVPVPSAALDDNTKLPSETVVPPE